jgi:hypothetical protein
MDGFNTLRARLIGRTPLLMHNANILVNPRSAITQLIKQYTSKRKKVEEDLDVISQLEWYASLYLDAPHSLDVEGANIQFTDDGANVCLTASVIKGMLLAGARKKKLGTTFKAGIVISEDAELNIFTDKDTNQLWADENYVDVRAERVQKNAVMRTRPIFRKWEADISIDYMPDVVNKSDIMDILYLSGKIIGLCDRRPEFGRFEVQA